MVAGKQRLHHSMEIRVGQIINFRQAVAPPNAPFW
jgi:hypothetical protein